jgi:hypothetical protein
MQNSNLGQFSIFEGFAGMASRDLDADFFANGHFLIGLSIYISLVQKKSPEIMPCPCEQNVSSIQLAQSSKKV